MKTYIVKINDNDLPDSIEIIKAINRMMEKLNYKNGYLGCNCDIHHTTAFDYIIIELGFNKKQSTTASFFNAIDSIIKKIDPTMNKVDAHEQRITQNVYEYSFRYENNPIISDDVINKLAYKIATFCKNDIMSIDSFEIDNITRLSRFIANNILEQYEHKYHYTIKQAEQLLRNPKLYAVIDNDLYDHLNAISDEIEQKYIDRIKQIDIDNIDVRRGAYEVEVPRFGIYNDRFKILFPKSFAFLASLLNKINETRKEYLQKLQQKRNAYESTSEYLLDHYFKLFIGQLSHLSKTYDEVQKNEIVKKILQLYEKIQNLPIDDTIDQDDKNHYLQSMQNNMDKRNIDYR